MKKAVALAKISFLREIFISVQLLWTLWSNPGENSYGVFRNYKMFLDRWEDRQLLATTQNAKGKHELFLYLKQASNTRQVLKAKKIM